MPAPDLSSFKVVNAEVSSATKFNNLVQAIQDEFADVDADQIPGYPSDATKFLRGDGAWAVPAGAGVPTGVLAQFAGATAPSGWLLCDGAAVSRTTFATLYAEIGTAYGVGDGSTTFNLPDLRGRVPVGKGTHVDVDTLGDSDGITTVANRRPKHKHTASSTDSGHGHTGSTTAHANGGDQNVGGGGGGIIVAGPSSAGSITVNSGTASITTTVGPQTGAEPTDSEAYLVVNYIIKT